MIAWNMPKGEPILYQMEDRPMRIEWCFDGELVPGATIKSRLMVRTEGCTRSGVPSTTRWSNPRRQHPRPQPPYRASSRRVKSFDLISYGRLVTEETNFWFDATTVVRGLVQIVSGLAPIRNKMSDGHARERKPEAHHARVIANAAKTVSTFMVESYLVQRERGLLTGSLKTGAAR